MVLYGIVWYCIVLSIFEVPDIPMQIYGLLDESKASGYYKV